MSSTTVNLGFPRITPAVKWLVIVTVGVYIVQVLVEPPLFSFSLTSLLGFHSYKSPNFFLWQPISYIFAHGSPTHLLFNMLGLWMLGGDYERQFGSSRLLQLYFISGILAALLYQLIFINFNHSLVGASAAIYAVFVSFVYFWPNAVLYIFGIFPLKAKFLLMILIGLDLLMSIVPGQGFNIAYLAHLLGALIGFIFLQIMHRRYPIFQSFFQLLYNWIQQLKSSFKTKKVQKEKAKIISKEEWVQEKVDLLLDKVSKYGIQSLTKKEKEFLDKISMDYKTKSDNNF